MGKLASLLGSWLYGLAAPLGSFAGHFEAGQLSMQLGHNIMIAGLVGKKLK